MIRQTIEYQTPYLRMHQLHQADETVPFRILRSIVAPMTLFGDGEMTHAAVPKTPAPGMRQQPGYGVWFSAGGPLKSLPMYSAGGYWLLRLSLTFADGSTSACSSGLCTCAGWRQKRTRNSGLDCSSNTKGMSREWQQHHRLSWWWGLAFFFVHILMNCLQTWEFTCTVGRQLSSFM